MVLRTLDPPLGPPSTLAEIFWRMCLQSHLQKFVLGRTGESPGELRKKEEDKRKSSRSFKGFYRFIYRITRESCEATNSSMVDKTEWI